MKKEITDEQLIALIEGNSKEELQRLIDEEPRLQRRIEELMEVLHIIGSTEEVNVPDQIGSSFQAAILKEEIARNNAFPWMQVAVAILILVVGFSLGLWSGNSNNASDELAALRNEVQSLKNGTLTSRLQRHSASERIMAVNRIEETPSINFELLSTLITTLNSDESPNVRYAALQALKKFIDNDDVKAELVKSLETQSDPLIQISLITILVEAEERSAIAPLKDIIENEEITPEVKRQAQVALKVLT